MKTSTEKTIYMAIGVGLFAACLWFIQVDSIIDPIAAAFVVAMGSFLGIDLVGMIRNTSKMPKGKYQPMRKKRYIFSFVAVVGLFLEALLVKALNADVSLTLVLGSLGSCAMLIIGMLTAGLEANKIASESENKK